MGFWESDWYQDCDTATINGAHIGGAIGGVAAGVGDVAAAFGMAENPPAAYETLIHAGGAATLGAGVGTGVGSIVGYAECEANNSILDGLHAFGDWINAPAPPVAPAWDSGLASNAAESTRDFHSEFSDVPSYADTHSSDM